MTSLACTPQQYADQADADAYATVSAGRQAALGQPGEFDVRYQPFCPDANGVIRLGRKTISVRPAARPDVVAADLLGPPTDVLTSLGAGAPGAALNSIEAALRVEASLDHLPVTLTLDECLHIAVRNSREFQQRKETLYSTALNLAEQRRAWNWTLFGGSARADASWQRTMRSEGEDPKSSSGEGLLTLTRRFANGGALALAAAMDYTTDFLGSASTPVSSMLRANFTQPLLQGAWRGLAYEDQYRLERNFLIAVFEYERFTQQFAVGILTQYYRTLELRDQLANEARNIQRVADTVEVTKVLVEGGQAPRTDADEAEQDLIDAKVRYQQQLQSYENQLDRFKIQLGLPIQVRIRLDYPDTLSALNKIGPRSIPFQEDQAVEIALSTRPDVLSRRAELRDVRRDVEIAADAFLPRLDLALGISADSSGNQSFWEIRPDRHTRFGRLEFSYQIDQVPNRNAYRNELIRLQRVQREYEAFVDQTVRLGVRDAYRNLMQSRTSYELQKQNVEIAERRRALVVLEQRAGRASADDVLRAERALRQARNDLTAALIDYTTTRLSFLADLGMIWVDEQGGVHERDEPFQFQRIVRRYPHMARRQRTYCASFDGQP